MAKAEYKREEFKGRSGQLKNSEYLSSEDLDGLEVTLTIKKIWKEYNVPTENGRVESEIATVEFEEAKKRLWLNSVNRKTLATAFGTDTKNWHGKKIIAYVQHGIRNPKGGEPVSGIRLKVDPKVVAEERKNRVSQNMTK